MRPKDVNQDLHAPFRIRPLNLIDLKAAFTEHQCTSLEKNERYYEYEEGCVLHDLTSN